jgi:hypothetical protein
MEGVEFNLEYRLMKEQIGRTDEQANENKKAEIHPAPATSQPKSLLPPSTPPAAMSWANWWRGVTPVIYLFVNTKCDNHPTTVTKKKRD